MLPLAVHDRPHAFLDHHILRIDPGNAGEVHRSLHLSVDEPIVGLGAQPLKPDLSVGASTGRFFRVPHELRSQWNVLIC